MRYCKECGLRMKEGSRYCPSCGCPVQEEKENGTQEQQEQVLPVSDEVRTTDCGERPVQDAPGVQSEEQPEAQEVEQIPVCAPEIPHNRPDPRVNVVPQDEDFVPEVRTGPFSVLSVSSYVLSFLLFSIPVVGLVIAIVWAAGGAHNRNRQNMGKAYLLLMLAVLLIFAGVLLGLYFQFQAFWLFG